MESRFCWKPRYCFGKHGSRLVILARSEKMQRKRLPVFHDVRSKSRGFAREIDKDEPILRHVPRHQIPKHRSAPMFTVFGIYDETVEESPRFTKPPRRVSELGSWSTLRR